MMLFNQDLDVVVGGDVYPSVDSPVYLPGGRPLHHHLRRHPPQDAGR